MSPLRDFVDELVVAHVRQHVRGLARFSCPQHEPTVCEDLGLLITYGGVVGIRSSWVRRTAQPIYLAWRLLQTSRDPLRFQYAYEIVMQCDDRVRRGKCLSWIAEREQRLQRRRMRPTVLQYVLGLFQ